MFLVELIHDKKKFSWKRFTKDIDQYIRHQRLPPHPDVQNPMANLSKDCPRLQMIDPDEMDGRSITALYTWIYLSHFTDQIPDQFRFRFRGESARLRCPSLAPNDSAPKEEEETRATPPSKMHRKSSKLALKGPSKPKGLKSRRGGPKNYPPPPSEPDDNVFLKSTTPQPRPQPRPRPRFCHTSSSGEDFSAKLDDADDTDTASKALLGTCSYSYFRLELPVSSQNPEYDVDKVRFLHFAVSVTPKLRNSLIVWIIHSAMDHCNWLCSIGAREAIGGLAYRQQRSLFPPCSSVTRRYLYYPG